MKSKNKARWFVRRACDGRMLCTDGLWRLNCADVDDIKFYTSDNRAIKYGLRGCDGCAYAVYPTDSIDIFGRIGRNEFAVAS